MNNNAIRNSPVVEPSASLLSIVDTLERQLSEHAQRYGAEEWLQLLDRGEFEECISILDSNLAQNPGHGLAKMVWIRAHLGARQLPTTALCAPLEEVALTTSTDPILGSFKKALFLRAAFALSAAGQSRLSWSMVERSLAVEVTSETASEQGPVLAFAQQSLNTEIARAQEKREPSAYIQSLQVRCEEIGKQLATLEASSRSSTLGTQRSPEKESVVVATTLRAKDIALNAPAPAAMTPDEETPVGSKNKLLVLISACLALVALGNYLLSKQSAEPAAKPQIALALPQPSQLLMPELQTSRTVPLDEKLDSVGQRLAKLAQDEIEEEATTSATTTDEIDSEALNPENAKHLKTPISPQNDELVAIDGESQESGTIPSFDSSTINSATTQSVESIGSNSRGNPIPPAALGDALKVDPQGRVFGPSSNQDQAGSNIPRTALDGSPLRSYEVQQFSPPKLFKTITATRVLSAPSILSTTLAELPENTPIHVSAQMGRWLELRSTGGRVGYIFSQDAVGTK